MLAGLTRSLLVFVLLSLSVLSAKAAGRVALVVGNGAYEQVAKLANPRNDANEIAKKLRSMGFDVVEVGDAGLRNMQNAVVEFTRKIKNADLAVFYYAGHGLQVKGRNYLVPVDANIDSEDSLDFQTMPVNVIIQRMERHAKSNIVFLDACRDNPLSRTLARSMGTRSSSVGSGLASIGSGVGTLISFATKPGAVALDGRGKHSPFTKALLKHIDTPGQPILNTLIAVRKDVMRETNNKQVPWENSSLTQEIVFNAEKTEPVIVMPKISEGQIELSFWNSIGPNGSAASFQAYLNRYPEGQFASLAKAKLQGMASAKIDNKPNVPAQETAQEPTEEKVAVLIKPEAPARPAAEPVVVEPKPDQKLLAKNVQTELNRVGCSVGRPDGVVGKRTQRALLQYAKLTDFNVDTNQPVTGDLLQHLQKQEGRICPIIVQPKQVKIKPQRIRRAKRNRVSSGARRKRPVNKVRRTKKRRSNNCFQFNGKTLCN